MKRRKHEPYLEQRLREAMGDPTRLAGAGKPLPGIDGVYDPDWWLKGLIRRERLEVVPPSLELQRRVEQALALVREMKDESTVRRQLEALNEEIARVNATVTTGPSTALALIDVEAEVEGWRNR